jgi:hypothetical protein
MGVAAHRPMTAGSSGGLRVRDPRRAFVFLPKLGGASHAGRAAFFGATKDRDGRSHFGSFRIRRIAGGGTYRAFPSRVNTYSQRFGA